MTTDNYKIWAFTCLTVFAVIMSVSICFGIVYLWNINFVLCITLLIFFSILLKDECARIISLIFFFGAIPALGYFNLINLAFN